jgi:hypothetical protein
MKEKCHLRYSRKFILVDQSDHIDQIIIIPDDLHFLLFRKWGFEILSYVRGHSNNK